MKKISLDDKLFIGLIISTILSYSYHALLLIVSGRYSLWTYSSADINVGIIGKIFIYAKDIIVILLMIYYIMKNNKKLNQVKIIFYSVILYGSIVLFIKGNFDIRYIVAGIRVYMYFVVTIMWCKYRTEKKNIDTVDSIISKILILYIYIQFIVVFSQVFLSNSLSNFGSGGYRFSGTFGNSGGLGSYCVAMAGYIVILSYIKEFKNLKFTLLNLISILLISIASGMRSSIVSIAIIILSYLITISYRVLKLNTNTIFFSFFTIGIISGPIIYDYIINRIGRGKLMDSGGTRLSIFLDLIYKSDFFTTLIGNGLGYGTNTAVNLNIVSAQIFDGTINTTIGQFGLIGLIIFCTCSTFIFINIYLKSNGYKLVSFCIIMSILIIFITGNYFEQISMVIISTYSIYILISKNSKFKSIN